MKPWCKSSLCAVYLCRAHCVDPQSSHLQCQDDEYTSSVVSCSLSALWVYLLFTQDPLYFHIQLLLFNHIFNRFISTGVKCEQLTQPASVTVQPGQRLSISCRVSYSLGSYATAWIRQPAGKGLEWIGAHRAGYTVALKDSLKNKFSIDLDSSSNTVTLNGQNMQPQDTAVYFCARDPESHKHL